MTKKTAEQFLLSLSNLPRKEYMAPGARCDVYLKRMRCFLDMLGNPEQKIPHYMHIAGTSGKGSTARFAYAILREAGYRTGLTVSPHAESIEERWEIQGTRMTHKEFADIVEKIKPALDRYLRESPYDMVSYFEITTAIAFLYFAKKKVEWAVIETGCGGRYDASNAIPKEKKDIAIITNIGLDHTEILGDTKEQIAYEKAGIITPACRVFTAEKNKKILSIIAKEAEKKQANIKLVTRYALRVIQSTMNGATFSYRNHPYQLQTIGDHQIKNAILAIEAARSIGIPEAIIAKGIKKTKTPYCMETLSISPHIILDGAHNPDKMQTTVHTTASIITANLHLILGFSDNKNWRRMIKQIASLNPNTVACTRFTGNLFRKAADPKQIQAAIQRYAPGATTQSFLDPADAAQWVKKQMKKHDILLATGSLFLAGEIRKTLTKA